MSTPTGDSRDPTDASADGQEKTNRSDLKAPESGGDADRLRSSYARLGPHHRTGAEGRPAANERDLFRSPYAPKTASRRPTMEGARRDEIMGALDRLEASLLRPEREQTAGLPRGVQLPPAVRLALGRDYRSPYSLEPERIPPEALMSRRDRLRLPLGILGAVILAASIVFYFLIAVPPSPRGPQIAAVAPPTVAPPTPTLPEQRQPIRAQGDDAGTAAQDETSSRRSRTLRIVRAPESATGAGLQPTAPGTQDPSAGKAARALDPEEIQLLIKQGEQYAEAGDLAGARIQFQRAAEAGDATAATALGATYDPTVFTKLGVVGIGADLEKARFWYQKAARLGSADARRRLDLLANR